MGGGGGGGGLIEDFRYARNLCFFGELRVKIAAILLHTGSNKDIRKKKIEEKFLLLLFVCFTAI